MASPAPGWYDDPAHSGRLRYWDGSAWTEHLADPPGTDRRQDDRQPPLAPGTSAAPGASTAPRAESGPPAPVTGQAPAARPAPAPLPPGRPTLASWWRRLGARIVDDLICALISLLPAMIMLSARWEQLETWSRSMQAAGPGSTMAPLPEGVAATVSAIGALAALVYFLYELIGLQRFGTTPGRRLLGIEVRVDGRAGPLTAQAASRRAGVKVVGQLLGAIPVLSTLGLMVILFDLGRGLLDRGRRTLHDLAGGTEVYRTQAFAATPPRR